MSKLLIVQVVFALVLALSVLVIGVRFFGAEHLDPDVILPWGCAAAVGFAGGWICLILRLLLSHRRKTQD